MFAASLLSLSACAVGPDYERPKMEVPAAYKELSQASGDWVPALARDGDERGAWWELYNDPALTALERQVEVSNQNLKAAEAAWRAARASVDESRASLFPTLSLDGSGTRHGSGAKGVKSYSQYGAGASASWDVDVWGRLRRGVESDEAAATASAADLRAARLSAQADLATNYFNLRVQDELIQALGAAAKAASETATIVKNQYNAGLAAKADVLSAETQVHSAESALLNAKMLRAQHEHVLALLVGKAPSDFSLPRADKLPDVPRIPVEVPSLLLLRRPDIAAAERRVAEANARIGVETAAWFPNLTLSASYGFSAQMLSRLLQASNSLWSLGPALAQTVFDGGARSARIRGAEASYDEAVANYKQTTLAAFKDVEDELAALNALSQREKVEIAARDAARASLALTTNQYKAGTVGYSNVLTAQMTALSHEQSALSVMADRFAASVSLIRALGGGWDGGKTGE
ncbi:MAG: efflux transporter outer membrane subunit [Bdellovibrionales bacterium]